MRAILLDRYGPPAKALRLADMEPPEPAADQVLIRVRASSVNALDWHVIRADPFIVRVGGGFRGPKDPRIGSDAAGVVEAVGAEVTDLRVGDEVYGTVDGAFAEFAVGRKLVRKPANLSFEEAAAVPIAASTALQTIRDQGQVQPGHRVAVVGGGGGVGSFAVQLAKVFGAHVTATTNADKVAFVRSLGADAVLDYTRDDVRSAGPFDAVLDIGGRGSIPSLRSAVARDGRLVLVAAGHGRGGPLVRIAAAMIRSRLLRQRVIFSIASITPEDLAALRELIEAGRIRPVIDRVYPLDQTAAAVERVEREEACGKVVVSVYAMARGEAV